jgi:hypothetical protein
MAAMLQMFEIETRCIWEGPDGLEIFDDEPGNLSETQDENFQLSQIRPETQNDCHEFTEQVVSVFMGVMKEDARRIVKNARVSASSSSTPPNNTTAVDDLLFRGSIMVTMNRASGKNGNPKHEKLEGSDSSTVCDMEELNLESSLLTDAEVNSHDGVNEGSEGNNEKGKAIQNGQEKTKYCKEVEGRYEENKQDFCVSIERGGLCW